MNTKDFIRHIRRRISALEYHMNSLREHENLSNQFWDYQARCEELRFLLNVMGKVKT